MLMVVDFLMIVGFAMPTETERGSVFVEYFPTTIAGIFFMVQFFVFMYDFNFNGVVPIAFLGWLVLIPGFLLISLSKSSAKKEDSERIGKKWMHSPITLNLDGTRIIRHPFLFGWILIIVGLPMISQNWLTVFCLGIQLPLIVFVIYSDTESNEKNRK